MTPQHNLDFSEALRACKAGARIARTGWNGEGMWVAWSPGHDALPAASFWAGPNRDYAEAIGGTARVQPSFTMKTADGSIQIGWLASQSDMNATDWMILP